MGTETQSVGHALKARRLERSLSYDDVAGLTRIKSHYLQAIEDMDVEALPSLGYVLGYVKTYAKCVGLPAEDMVKQFKADIQAPKFIGMRAKTVFAKKRRIRLPRGFISAMLVMGCAVGLAGWYNVNGQIQPLAEALPATEPTTAQDLEAIRTLTNNPNVLTLKAIGPTWLQVNDIAQGVTLSRILIAGETWQTPKTDDIRISMRDAGALELYQGDKLIGVLGAKGEPKRDFNLSEMLRSVSVGLPLEATNTLQ